MRKIFFTLIIVFISFSSCEKKELSKEIEGIYFEFANRESDSIKIEEIKILNEKIVTKNYNRKIQINNLNYVIELSKQSVENSKEVIRLLRENIEKRLILIEINEEKREKYLAENDYDENKVEKEKLEIKQMENQITITNQKIVLLNAEFDEREDENYQLIEYVFKGEIERNVRIDTLKLLLQSGYEPKFVKNDKFISFQMIKTSLQ